MAVRWPRRRGERIARRVERCLGRVTSRVPGRQRRMRPRVILRARRGAAHRPRAEIAAFESGPAQRDPGLEVAGARYLSRDDREVHLHLNQPTGVDWYVNEHEVGPALGHAIDGRLATMAPSVVHHLEHAPVSTFTSTIARTRTTRTAAPTTLSPCPHWYDSDGRNRVGSTANVAREARSRAKSPHDEVHRVPALRRAHPGVRDQGDGVWITHPGPSQRTRPARPAISRRASHHLVASD